MATLGTATSEEHAKRLFSRGGNPFCSASTATRLAAMPPGAPSKATLSSLQDGRRARFLFLPEGEDPDTLVRSKAPTPFARINQHAQPLADYFFQQLTEEADPRSLEARPTWPPSRRH